MKHTYTTRKTCSRQISFELDGNIVKNVRFYGGCDGNLKAVSALVEGLTVEQVEQKVRGIRCGFKETSCSDQLAIAVRQAYEEENTEK